MLHHIFISFIIVSLNCYCVSNVFLFFLNKWTLFINRVSPVVETSSSINEPIIFFLDKLNAFIIVYHLFVSWCNHFFFYYWFFSVYCNWTYDFVKIFMDSWLLYINFKFDFPILKMPPSQRILRRPRTGTRRNLWKHLFFRISNHIFLSRDEKVLKGNLFPCIRIVGSWTVEINHFYKK